MPTLQVMEILATQMAKTLTSMPELIEAAGTALDASPQWTPTLASLALVRDKGILDCMLNEARGWTHRNAAGETSSEKRRLILATPDSDRTKWLPKWLQFPQAKYTDRPLSK